MQDNIEDLMDTLPDHLDPTNISSIKTKIKEPWRTLRDGTITEQSTLWSK